MQLVPYKPEGFELLMKGAMAFSKMQQAGIRLDMLHLKSSYKRLGKEIKEQQALLDQCKEVQLWKKKYGEKFKLDSDEQLADILFNEMGHEPTSFTDSGKASVNADVLKSLNIPVGNILLKYRKYFKLRNTFLNGIITEAYGGYLHPFLNLHTARTFRSSGNMPNVQNMPIRDPEAGEIIRKAFIAREGHHLVCADYGGIEVKMAAVMHQDPTMLGYLNDPLHADMHADFACLIFKLDHLDGTVPGEKTLRKGTKNGFTFPQFYGDYYGNNAPSLWKWAGLEGEKIRPKDGVKIKGDITIGRNLINHGIKTFEQFKNHIKEIEHTMWHKRFPVYTQWKEKQLQSYTKKGFVEILTGFICQGLMDKNAVINYPIQGLAFHCLLWSCVELLEEMKKRKMKSRIVFQVHDDVVADVATEEREEYISLLKEVMVRRLRKHWTFINIPLELEIESSELNGNWHDKKPVTHYIA